MDPQIQLLMLGFIFTTVGGGVLGYYFQNRTWSHQNSATLQVNERSTAKDVFERVSNLLDRRMYRMRLLYWGLESETASDETIAKYMADYREILYEWNDSLIRNLALVQAYFGKEIRRELGGLIYEECKRIGNAIETQYKERKSTDKPSKHPEIEKELEKLSREVYALNFQMINLIQAGKVGLFNPNVLREIKEQPSGMINKNKTG